MNTKIKPCPYCVDFHDESSESMVETHVDNFVNSMAIQCDYCGLRSMSVEQQEDYLMVKCWNNLVDCIVRFEKESGTK